MWFNMQSSMWRIATPIYTAESDNGGTRHLLTLAMITTAPLPRGKIESKHTQFANHREKNNACAHLFSCSTTKM